MSGRDRGYISAPTCTSHTGCRVTLSGPRASLRTFPNTVAPLAPPGSHRVRQKTPEFQKRKLLLSSFSRPFFFLSSPNPFFPWRMIAPVPVQMFVLLLLLLFLLGSVSGFGQVQQWFSTTKTGSSSPWRDGEMNSFILCFCFCL